MNALLHEARLAARSLARQPLLTAVVVATLGFGIGANTAIFSFVNALLLRPYAFPDLDRLVTLSERHPQQGGQASVRPSDAGHPIAPADFLDLRRQSRSFEGLAAIRQRDFTLVGPGGPERLMGALVTPEFFALLRADARLGRTLRPEEADAGRDAVVVVSHGLWQRRLGGAADVLGRTLVLNGRSFTLIGVMPATFAYPMGGVELWTPLALSEQEKVDRTTLSLRALGRLAPGATLSEARADLAGIAQALARDHPRSNGGRSFGVVPLREQQAGLTGPFAALFQAAALLVLVIACANVSGVLLTRTLARQRELALRAALGASRWRVARQILIESLALSLLGALVALWVAGAGVRAIRAGVPPDITKWVAGWTEIRLDERALAVALLAALASALATGLLPALAATRPGLVAMLREGGRGAGAGPRGWRGPLVIGQMSLALVLGVTASLMLRGSLRLVDRYGGLEPAGVLTFHVALPDSRYPAGQPVADFYARLLAGLTGMPGVESVAAVAQLPGDLGPVPGGAVSVKGRTAPGDPDLPTADYQTASPDYFRTLRIRLLSGRFLVPQDGRGAPPVAVVSESMARRLWPAGHAVGQHVKQGRPDDPAPWREVVGVVEDVTQYWFDAEPRSTLYVPLEQAPRTALFVLVRGHGDVTALAPLLRPRVFALDPELPIDELRTLRSVVDEGMAILLLSANLLVILGAVSLGLSALGVYGIVAQDVAQRTKEIAVRLALGAEPGQVRGMVLRGVLGLTSLALLVGVPAAVATSRLLQGALFGVVRPATSDFVVYSGGLLAVALLASWAPARRAAAMDPVVALNNE